MTIIESVAQVYGIDKEAIKLRQKNSVEPRMVCIAIYRATGRLKTCRGINEFDVKKSCVSKAMQKTAWFIKYDKSFRVKVIESLKMIYDSKEQRERTIEKMLNFKR